MLLTLAGKQKKRSRQPSGLVIHGNINLAPQGQIVNTRNGNVSISVEGPAKRQCREPTPAFGEDKQDGEGSTKRRRSELTPALDEESNSEDEGYDRDKDHIEDEEYDKVEEHDEESNEYGDYDDYEEDASTPPPYDDQLHAFLVAFLAMKHKRQFTSGRTLQDIIHIGVLKNPSSAGKAIHWIIDLTDITVKSWFDKDELEELLGWIPPTPQVDESFTYARERYRNVSV